VSPQSALKPIPRITAINEPFFRGAIEGELRLQVCQSCGRWIYFPRIACPHCFSDRMEWRRASGRGTLYSFAVVYRAQHPAFNDEVPIVVGAVTLEEGPVLITEVSGAAPDAVSIGMPVEALWEQRTPEIAILKFCPVTRANGPREPARSPQR
jgi:uncharacterized OB-fold protein